LQDYYLRTNAPNMKVGTFAVPVPPNAVSTKPLVPSYADGGWAINGHIDAAKQAAAETFVKWLGSPAFGQLMADNLKMFSAIPGVTYTDDVMKQMWADYQAGPAAYLMLVNFRYCNPTADSILGPNIQKMFLGQLTAQAVVDDVTNGVSTCTLPKF
jgi:raffinose/stachyose/melibiose transport system substrate-binding protein